MSEATEETPPPRRRRDDAITMTGVLKWGGAGASVAAAVWLAGTTYRDATDKIASLEHRLTVVEQQRDGDTKRFNDLDKHLVTIERKIDLFMCAANPAACAAMARASTENP